MIPLLSNPSATTTDKLPANFLLANSARSTIRKNAAQELHAATLIARMGFLLPNPSGRHGPKNLNLPRDFRRQK
jgi:hypothetical protein